MPQSNVEKRSPAGLAVDPERDRYARWVSATWGVIFLVLIALGIYGAISYRPADQSSVRPPTAPPPPSGR